LSKTKKQVENELEQANEEISQLKAQYNQLMVNAQEIKKLADNRLMSIRLLETFVNTVRSSMDQLLRDMMELGLVQRQVPEDGTQADGGEQ
tara:strand:- start:173 stop:445 length:273 start_codon:yes stop_codon:yes gene_type:complete